MSLDKYLEWGRLAKMEIDEMMEPGNLSQARRDWEELTQNPAWLQLVAAIQAQTDSLQQSILFGPVTSEADLYRLEREKGQLEGRLSITATAEAMMQGVEYDLKQAIERKENEQDAADADA